ncbi:transposase [Streptomyces rapamycinicus]|uniref:transposase n=1 Tax=Streptomyces rapamycinicus TaxID=1226757 RepID=UPI001FAA608A|nr:transposase [Streptomyces rapamycinicus]UTO62106.1 transposase [Streptomyces rapamycinicus]UTP30058.1 transposase [Streptomyces rapamycinicus NRRL 5491]
MAEKRRKFDAEFREGAVRIVTETGKTVAEVAKDLGSTRPRWPVGYRGPVARAPRRAAGMTSWSGCGGRMPSSNGTTRNSRWSVMSSNAAWSCG